MTGGREQLAIYKMADDGGAQASVEELRQCCEAAIASKHRGDALEFHSVVQRITSCSDHVRPFCSQARARCAQTAYACPVRANLQGMLRQWLGALTHCASGITVRDHRCR